MEDVSAVLVFLVKSSSTGEGSKGNYLKQLFGSTLTDDSKGREIASLFSRETSKPDSDKLSCSRCEIYKVEL